MRVVVAAPINGLHSLEVPRHPRFAGVAHSLDTGDAGSHEYAGLCAGGAPVLDGTVTATDPGDTMRYRPSVPNLALCALAACLWGCRSYQPTAPAGIRPESTVLITFQNTRDWMVPRGASRDPRAVRSRRLLARAVTSVGDTLVVIPVRLEDQRGQFIAYPRNAERLRFTPADEAQISTLRYNRTRTGGMIVGTLVVLVIMASQICIMCDTGDGGSFPY